MSENANDDLEAQVAPDAEPDVPPEDIEVPSQAEDVNDTEEPAEVIDEAPAEDIDEEHVDVEADDTADASLLAQEVDDDAALDEAQDEVVEEEVTGGDDSIFAQEVDEELPNMQGDIAPVPSPTQNPVDILPPSTTASSDQLLTESSVDIPPAPHLPMLIPETLGDMSTEGAKLSTTALSMVWSFGLNRNVPVLNLSDMNRKLIAYACAHTTVLFDFVGNRQRLLQGHANAITCTCVSADKKWLATGDKGADSMVIIWDTHTSIPVQTLFEANIAGVVAICMTQDARYLATLSAGESQTFAIWDWTLDGETPVSKTELDPAFGIQNYICFNPEDIHYVVTNSETQVIFFQWEHGEMKFFAPPLTDQDFNKPVGRYSQSIFQRGSSRALTGTSIGNLVVWDNNNQLTKVQSAEPSADKKALKIIKLQERGLQVLTTTDRHIVVGDAGGHVKFFDQTLKLLHWYQDFNMGPVNSVSFAHAKEFVPNINRENSDYPPDATISAAQFVIRNFVVGTSTAVIGHITADGSGVEEIHREHDAAIHALAAHPFEPRIAVGSYSGLLKIWDYEQKKALMSRQFDKGNLINTMAYCHRGAHLAIGFVNGMLRIVDPVTLEDELTEPYRYARDVITHIAFSSDSKFLATADAEYTTTVFCRERGVPGTPYSYLGRHRAHYKPIKDIIFGRQLDCKSPRLMSLGEDRLLVEYDLDNSCKDNLKLLSSDRIEQSAVPGCIVWYPPITKENFILTANDQYKFKLYNTTTKMCRKTLLGPTYGSPLNKIAIIPAKDVINDKRYLAYITNDKVGLEILPLDGNPHNTMALVAHPGGVSNMVCSSEGNYLFTAGGADATLHMWQVNTNALQAQSLLGGEGLVPFYGLLDGGREGELFAELEDYFYYAQIRNQGVDAMESRVVSTQIPLAEIPFVMRAMGFYPSEQEIEDMINEVKFSLYVETGKFMETIDLGQFIKLYINHRPAFGLSAEKILWAFEKLGYPCDDILGIERGDFLDLLQTKGEHMTENEVAEYLSTLLGFNEEGGSSELGDFDASAAGEELERTLPNVLTSDMFSEEILGFSMYGGAQREQSQISVTE